MPTLTDHFYSMTQLTPTREYIETGAYLGDGIRSVIGYYETIHSIELSERWYAHNVEQFKMIPNVHVHLGDSSKVLPRLLDEIKQPVTIFLDAHYSGAPTAFGDEETPLLKELDLLRKRPYDDIIIIDDIRFLGSKGTCGAGPDDPVYPTMQYDWSDITAEAIVARMKDNYRVVNNEGQRYTPGAEDQLILYPVKAE